MRRLHPDPAETSLEEELADLGLPARSLPERPYAIANFAMTADGRASIGGRSGPIGSNTDTEVLQRLRTQVDAVMIGAGTMRAERYGRMVPDAAMRDLREALGLARDPIAVLITRSLDLPWDAGLFTCGKGSVLVYSSAGPEPPETATPVEVIRHPATVDLAEMMSDLRRRGVRAFLTEGGPTVLAELIERRLLDELFLTIAPKLAGEPTAPTILEGPLTEPLPLTLHRLLEEDGELYARYGVSY